MLTRTRRLSTRKPATLRPRTRRRPQLEAMEARQLLTGYAFLQGISYADNNSNNQPDLGEALPNATIQLFRGSTQIGQATTDADGRYYFDDTHNLFAGEELVAPGSYTLKEVPPGLYDVTGAQALSQLNPATVTAAKTIDVQLVDPSKVYLSYLNTVLTKAVGVRISLNNQTIQGAAGQLRVALGTNFGQQDLSGPFISYCVDILNDLRSLNGVDNFQVVPRPSDDLSIVAATNQNGGRIAYLYNRYGTDPNLSLADSAGLQLAIWELVYDVNPDLNSGNFKILGAGTLNNVGTNFADARAAAQNFLSIAATNVPVSSRGENAILLDAEIPHNVQAGNGSQSMLATGSFNFANQLLPPATLSGYVYYDANDDGSRAGDAPIPGATVTLTGADDLGNPVNTSTTTDADGFYSFTGLRPGTYTLTEAQPGGYLDGKDTVGTPGGTTANDQFSAIALAAGVNGTENNFGERLPASISGRKFLDVTGNGLSPDDTGLGGTTIYLDLDNDNGLDAGAEPQMATLPDGTFTFANLQPGTYTVREVVSAGYIRTFPTLADEYSVTVAANQAATGIVFANAETCDGDEITRISYTITGAAGTRTVSNLRGNVDQGDTVTANFTVAPGLTHTFTLVSYTAPGASFDANNANQQRIFDIDSQTFGPGAHSLTVLVPNSYFQVDMVCGEAIDGFGPAGSNIFYTPQGRLVSADNDGTRPYADSSLSGYAYADANNNGTKDGGESGIAGVTITLTGTDIDGNPVSRSTTTNSSGYYSFTGLKASGPGGYVLTETQPAGYADGTDRIGSQGGTTGNDALTTVRINTNTNGVSNNFGERLNNASIGDRVWLDANLNGIQDSGEGGVGGVTVKLRNGSGNVVATTTTNASGNYSFTSLAAGTYSVEFVLPGGYGFTLRDLNTGGGTDSNDSDADAGTGRTANITLAAGQTNNTVDAGIYRVPTERLGAEGGTPGYWKNNAEKKGASAWGPTGLSPSQRVSTVFTATAGTSYGNLTLLQALGTGGGGTNALLRQAVAGLLNALHPDVYYSIYSTQVVLQVNAALYSGNATTIENLKNTLDGYNNKTHPLDQSGRRTI